MLNCLTSFVMANIQSTNLITTTLARNLKLSISRYGCGLYQLGFYLAFSILDFLVRSIYLDKIIELHRLDNLVHGNPSDWPLLCSSHVKQMKSSCLVDEILASSSNGSTGDQVTFVCQNILAQMKILLGQRLNSQQYLVSLTRDEAESNENFPTRTHIYERLIRRFGNGSWIDTVDLLPKMRKWERWRSLVTKSKTDPEFLYDECLRAEEIEEMAGDPETG